MNLIIDRSLQSSWISNTVTRATSLSVRSFSCSWDRDRQEKVCRRPASAKYGRSIYATFQCYPCCWTLSAASTPGIWHTRTRISRYRRSVTFALLKLMWKGLDHHTGDEVAIKLERRSEPTLLMQEVEIYETLGGKPGFPRLFWHGYQDDYRAMVFELLGPNLGDLFAFAAIVSLWKRL